MGSIWQMARPGGCGRFTRVGSGREAALGVNIVYGHVTPIRCVCRRLFEFLANPLRVTCSSVRDGAVLGVDGVWEREAVRRLGRVPFASMVTDSWGAKGKSLCSIFLCALTERGGTAVSLRSAPAPTGHGILSRLAFDGHVSAADFACAEVAETVAGG